MIVMGVDIGGSGIKASIVDTKIGKLLKPRERLDTPKPSKPKAVAQIVTDLQQHFKWQKLIGCAFPAVIKDGVALTAANVDKSWIGQNLDRVIGNATGCKTYGINDADAAGIAEMRFGAGKGKGGVVIMVTLGTGIGSAVFVGGTLLPNTELGHLILRGKDAEERASDRARKEKDLSWKKWGKKVDEYLESLEDLFFPDLFIIGGGVSKDFKNYAASFKRKAKVVPAKLKNDAGIIGAALNAVYQSEK